MLKVAICDDEKRMREYLHQLVDQCVEADVSEYESGEEFLGANESFDIILLDICMNGSDAASRMNGMDVARQIRSDSEAVIIFITALKEYVFDAYDVDAFHYLIKPIDEAKFRQVIDKAAGCVEKRKLTEPLVIKVNGNYRKIPISDIYYAENDARKIILHLKQEIITFYEKMEVLEQKLGNSFFRSHRGYLVHLQYVDHYDSTNIVLINGVNIYLAKHKYHEFVAAYMNYLTRV